MCESCTYHQNSYQMDVVNFATCIIAHTEKCDVHARTYYILSYSFPWFVLIAVIVGAYLIITVVYTLYTYVCSSILNFHVDLLSESDLVEVLQEVVQISNRWYEVGVMLKLSPTLLDMIHANNHAPHVCLIEVLHLWLRQMVSCLHRIDLVCCITV